MIYLALGSLSLALVATLWELGIAAVVLSQVGEILFVVSAISPRHAATKPQLATVGC